MAYDTDIVRFLVVDSDRRRWWFEDRLLPPAGAARKEVLRWIRVTVTNALHDQGIVDFGPGLTEMEPDSDGWRTLPPPESEEREPEPEPAPE